MATQAPRRTRQSHLRRDVTQSGERSELSLFDAAPTAAPAHPPTSAAQTAPGAPQAPVPVSSPAPTVLRPPETATAAYAAGLAAAGEARRVGIAELTALAAAGKRTAPLEAMLSRLVEIEATDVAMSPPAGEGVGEGASTTTCPPAPTQPAAHPCPNP